MKKHHTCVCLLTHTALQLHTHPDMSNAPLDPPLQTTKSVSPNRTEAALQLLTQYETLLAFLKSHGALLNGVKPEMLLESEDFGRVLSQRTSAAATADDEVELEQWALLEASFDAVSAQAWNALLSQLFKVFVLSRVTIRSMRLLPGGPRCT